MCSPHVSPSYPKQRFYGKSSGKLLQEFSLFKKQCWGRHLRARGVFVASSGVVTDEATMEYIRTHEASKHDEDFRIDGE
ncbi:transposase [Aquisphaera insulae]|uniref:transposase n=1 Tax=Aquisphaera insulae TaxID=2712864 RepID=UPI00196B0C30